MEDKNRNFTNDAIEKIFSNISGDLHNSDSQYVPLAFTPPPTTEMNWNQPQNNYINHYNMHGTDPMMGHTSVDPFSQNTFNYMPPTNNLFENSPFKTNVASISDFDVYKPISNGSSEFDLLDRYLLNQNMHITNRTLLPNQPEMHPPVNNHLIDNFVGNWSVPNNTGTYTPFGTSDTFKTNVFDLQPERENVCNNRLNQIKDDKYVTNTDTIEDKQYLFNGKDHYKLNSGLDSKPIRPSYSDVLTKPVPHHTVKPKNDVKEIKQKKENKKTSKTDKAMKGSISVNRSVANNDLKDLTTEKPQSVKVEKHFKNRTNQLSRKWASLDNVTEPLNKSNEKKKKNDDLNNSKSSKSIKKLNKTVNDISDTESDTIKNESLNVNKNGLKKISKTTGRQKASDSFGNNERPPGKRNQRIRKRENHVPFGIVGQKLKQYTKGWWKLFTVFVLWLFHLISDVCSLSVHISRDLAWNSWTWLNLHGSLFLEAIENLFSKFRLLNWVREKFKGRKKESPESEEDTPHFVQNGLQNNITMPTTGDEAMRRLLACKGKDPYSILGVTPTCTDDDIKRYYKRQAFLVHPDKNQLPGAEEAFKILVHAFDMIGEPERRTAYDRGVVESAQVVQAWSELNDLLQQLQQKVEAAANSIRCSTCGQRHKRIKVDRPNYAARNCNTCKIHHTAREGDIWAEARCFGFLWNYFACMEGAVYDITEWAGCQKESLKHLRPDTHHVQYRIALGKNCNVPRRHSGSPRTERPDLENLLNTLYGQNDTPQGTRRRNKRANKF